LTLHRRGVPIGPGGQPLDYTEKERIPVTIYTLVAEIRGILYYAAGQRTTDVLNRAEHFLPLTDVTITPLFAEGPPRKVSYLAVNLEQVVAVSEGF